MRLGLDIGGTKTAAAIVRDDGTVAALCTARSGYGPRQVVQVAAALARQAIAETGSIRPASAGACMPGLVEPSTGMVRHAVNLGVTGLNLAVELEAELGYAVAVENDVKAAALGADQLMAARTGLRGPGTGLYRATTHRTLAYLNIGTGLAAAVVRDGEVLRGLDGVVGEIGHLPMGGDARCKCGQTGCLETLASGSALDRLWAQPRGRDPFAAGAAGDEQAAAAARVLCTGIALSLQLLVLTTGADRIVLGGGLVALGPALRDGIRSELDRRADSSEFVSSLGLAERFELLPSDVPVAALGAALLPHHT
ncbi:ROK family protein [Paeniglutamicibacter cryotolerans]|uniref:Putative NBD/HSP70 family sugar kinase n=1 Tax=Paeniglutamicibacter cryotolerans TaxID=670079 RepID=A0A839QN42_9MICC|nr:ROK family protein [Paeniglutamicibacter cryotolerans]MBB2996045.1 putative NBD/HSP70 family sugar kinase [Paeniglutamicibacter cryotolerans]